MKITLLLAVMLVVNACSNSSTPNNSNSDALELDELLATPADDTTLTEFEGFWVLNDYTLNDGSMKSVPDSYKVSILASSNDTIEVQHGLCDSYQISYRLDNDVLTTSNHVSPEVSCAGLYADDDNVERSELLRLAFLNTQTLVAVSINLLTVTTVQNEILVFVRSEI